MFQSSQLFWRMSFNQLYQTSTGYTLSNSRQRDSDARASPSSFTRLFGNSRYGSTWNLHVHCKGICIENILHLYCISVCYQLVLGSSARNQWSSFFGYEESRWTMIGELIYPDQLILKTQLKVRMCFAPRKQVAIQAKAATCFFCSFATATHILVRVFCQLAS